MGLQRLESLLQVDAGLFQNMELFFCRFFLLGEFRFDPGIIGLQLGQCILECVVLLGSFRQFRFQSLNPMSLFSETGTFLRFSQ